MRIALLIAAAGCSTAMADEVDTTFVNDGWQYSGGWPLMGQTLTVPDSSNILESFSFVAKVYDEQPGEFSYIVALYEWDEQEQRVVGEPYFTDSGVVESGDVPLRTHDIGVLLPAGMKVGVVFATFADDDLDYGMGYTWNDEYAGGSFVGTHGDADEAWEVGDNPWHDLVFTANWKTCLGDVNGDGELTIVDFIAFQNGFTAGSPKADCDQNGVLNVLDFVCFQDVFQAGCGGQ
jgi:hypothetical protein